MLNVLLDQRLQATTRIYWLYLTTRPNHKTDVALAEALGFSSKTVQRARKELKQNGYAV
jgi:biotin operon repressor